MISGAHFVMFSKDPEADRKFISDVFGFRSVDVGEGWLVFALPPAELATHPAKRTFGKRQGGHSMAAMLLYLMCDDLAAVVRALQARKCEVADIVQAPWGEHTTLTLPSGGEIGLYQPTHVTAIDRKRPSIA